jgi:hypothetical protein
MLKYLLNNYGWLLGLGGAGAGLLAWSVGLPSVLRIVAAVVEALSPIAKAVMEWVVSGLKDIMDSMATIMTVLLLCYGVHLYDKVEYFKKHNITATQLNLCQEDVRRLTKSKKDVPEPEFWQFPFRLPF